MKWEKEYEEIMKYYPTAKVVAYLEFKDVQDETFPVILLFEKMPDGRIRYFHACRTFFGRILSSTIGFEVKQE